MPSSLFSALSGMSAHQRWIDVIGHNLANANTPGYKLSRATFSSAFAQTLRFPSGPSGNLGGTNATQIGLGVSLSGTDRTFSQGVLTPTGRIFDLALEGKGFFALSDGAQNFYTRVGTFGLDAEQNLVDQRTGLFVLDPTGGPMTLDTEALFPPQATSTADFKGNLPAVVNGPLAEVLTGNTALEEGTPAQLVSAGAGPYAVTTGATYTLEVAVNGGSPKLASVTDADNDGLLTTAEVAAALDGLDGVTATVNGSSQVVLATEKTGSDITLKVNAGTPNDLATAIGMSTTLVYGDQSLNPAADINTLPANEVDYANGDPIEITGVDTDGSAVAGTFTYGTDGTTIQDLIDFIDGLYTDATVELNPLGQIVVTAQTPGEADLLLSIADGAGATGDTTWTEYGVSVTTEGTAPDTVVTSTEIYDPAGTAHIATLTFERQPDLTWNVIASLADGEGTVLEGGVDDPITGLTFAEDGSPQGLGSVDGNLSLQFNGPGGPQTVSLDFGTDGEFDGLTQFGAAGGAYVFSQNGYGVGELSNIAIDSGGLIEGLYTNGQRQDLGTIGVATFINQEGLLVEGDNLYMASSNSGAVSLGAGAALGAGRVVGGALENSNVDTAEQFVRLIEAQRGFQANARVITTQDEILAEVVNLI